MESDQGQQTPMTKPAMKARGMAGWPRATLLAWAVAFQARVIAIRDNVPAQISGRVSAAWKSLVSYLPNPVQSRVDRYQNLVEEKATNAAGTFMTIADAAKANARTAAVITQERACELKATAKERAYELKATAKDTIADPKVQVTVAAAAGGAVSLGAGGGVAGLAGGGAVGAACGIVPAIFTFGLSIPIGAAIGAGTGLVVGTAVGGTVGLVGGGATGYGAYTKREELRRGAEGAWSKAVDCGDYIQAKATSSREFVKQTAVASAHTVRSRLCATTGGTE